MTEVELNHAHGSPFSDETGERRCIETKWDRVNIGHRKERQWV
jgi:hypothetical protein